MTKVVYPVGGGMEDWAYGAGFDSADGATVDRCYPIYYPIDEDFFSANTTENVRC